jgi:hypothetical protein
MAATEKPAVPKLSDKNTKQEMVWTPQFTEAVPTGGSRDFQ